MHRGKKAGARMTGGKGSRGGKKRSETVQRVKPYKGKTLISVEGNTQDLKPFAHLAKLSYTPI